MRNTDRIWKKTSRIFGQAVPKFHKPPMKKLPENCKTPYDFHRLFLSEKFIEKIVTMSKYYATRKNRPEVAAKINNNSILTSVAIMYMTGYLTPSNRMMYWQNRMDTINPFVKKAMARDTFVDIIQHTYFVDHVNPDPGDKFWKVRLLFNHLNETAKKYITNPENCSVDEGMVKYFGPHPLKQYMKGKPHRFGYKVWMLASSDGQLLAVQPYAGATTYIKDYGLGQGPNVVLGLADQFGLIPGTKVFVDNLFTSMDLLDHMGDRELGITGTLRQNRIIGKDIVLLYIYFYFTLTMKLFLALCYCTVHTILA